MSRQRKPLIISGGAGFIGTNICIAALKRGYEVVVLDNLSRNGSEDNAARLRSLGILVLREDVCSPTFQGLSGISGIIHLAANTGIGVSLNRPYFDFHQNVVGTVNLLEAARLAKVPLVYASTNKVYSDAVNEIPTRVEGNRYVWDDGITVNETFRTDGKHHTPYGVSKLSGDMYCQEYFQSFGVKTVVNRMSCIYGLYQNGAEEQGWVDHFIRTNIAGEGIVSIYGDGKQVRDVLWGGDVAELYLDELENINGIAGEVFNVGGGKDNTLSLLECMDTIQKETDQAFVPEFKDWRDADQKVYISNISKVKNKLGWSPKVSPQEGISLMIKEYKNGYN